MAGPWMKWLVYQQENVSLGIQWNKNCWYTFVYVHYDHIQFCMEEELHLPKS